ncbi:MAG: RDD family protein [Actinomycetota bacterium]
MPLEPLPPDSPLAGAQPSGLGRRAGAIAIDWLAALILARLFLPGVAYGSGTSALATLAIFFVEVVLLTWLTASSFGQRIVGIAVVGIDGQRLGLWRVVIRTLMICLVIPALVYDSRGRGLQDIVARSVVVMRRTVPGLAR